MNITYSSCILSPKAENNANISQLGNVLTKCGTALQYLQYYLATKKKWLTDKHHDLTESQMYYNKMPNDNVYT